MMVPKNSSSRSSRSSSSSTNDDDNTKRRQRRRTASSSSLVAHALHCHRHHQRSSCCRPLLLSFLTLLFLSQCQSLVAISLERNEAVSANTHVDLMNKINDNSSNNSNNSSSNSSMNIENNRINDYSGDISSVITIDKRSLYPKKKTNEEEEGYGSSYGSYSSSSSSSSSGGSFFGPDRDSTPSKSSHFKSSPSSSSSHYGSSSSSYGSYGSPSSSSYSSSRSKYGGSSSSSGSDYGSYGSSYKYQHEEPMVPLAWVILLIITFVGIGMLITANEFIYNTEGNLANFCRLSVKILDCIWRIIYNCYHCRLSEIPNVVWTAIDDDDENDGDAYTEEELQMMKLRPGIERALDVEHKRSMNRMKKEFSKRKTEIGKKVAKKVGVVERGPGLVALLGEKKTYIRVNTEEEEKGEEQAWERFEKIEQKWVSC